MTRQCWSWVQAYRAARNAVVVLYQEDVSRRLTFKQCRGQLHGDVNACLRVFQFLEHWGMINGQADGGADAKAPSYLVAPDGAALTRFGSAIGGSLVTRIVATESCLAMSAAVGQSDAMQLSAGASAPCVEALYRFRLPTPTEAGRSPLTGGPNSASLLPRAELSKQILTAAASKEVGA